MQRRIRWWRFINLLVNMADSFNEPTLLTFNDLQSHVTDATVGFLFDGSHDCEPSRFGRIEIYGCRHDKSASDRQNLVFLYLFDPVSTRSCVWETEGWQL